MAPVTSTNDTPFECRPCEGMQTRETITHRPHEESIDSCKHLIDYHYLITTIG